MALLNSWSIRRFIYLLVRTDNDEKKVKQKYSIDLGYGNIEPELCSTLILKKVVTHLSILSFRLLKWLLIPMRTVVSSQP